MNIKKVDDKPMVIHTKEKPKLKVKGAPETKIKGRNISNLMKMGVPEDLAKQAGNSRRGHWFTTHTVAVNLAMTKERLISGGFYDLATAYQSVHVNY